MRPFERSLPMALLRSRESIMAFFRPQLNALGLTEQQWRVIRVLHENSDLEFNELARIASILPPSLTGMLTRLERKGLLWRRKLARDQRRLHVGLTREGRARFAEISRHMERTYREIERQFGRARLAALFGLLARTRLLRPPAAESKP